MSLITALVFALLSALLSPLSPADDAQDPPQPSPAACEAEIPCDDARRPADDARVRDLLRFLIETGAGAEA